MSRIWNCFSLSHFGSCDSLSYFLLPFTTLHSLKHGTVKNKKKTMLYSFFKKIINASVQCSQFALSLLPHAHAPTTTKQKPKIKKPFFGRAPFSPSPSPSPTLGKGKSPYGSPDFTCKDHRSHWKEFLKHARLKKTLKGSKRSWKKSRVTSGWTWVFIGG